MIPVKNPKKREWVIPRWVIRKKVGYRYCIHKRKISTSGAIPPITKAVISSFLFWK
jgi:hypothetical protein